mgnify:CR=1 FL=1
MDNNKSNHNSKISSFKGHKVLVIGDTHDSPDIPKDRFLWIGKHIRKIKPDYVVHIGDFCSFDSLSYFQANDTQQGKLKDAFMVDILSMRTALALINKGMGNVQVPKHITLGNHEQRVHKFEEKIPEIEGMMKDQLYQSFHSSNWSVSEYGSIFFVSGVGFTHVPKNIMGKEYGGRNAEISIANAYYEVEGTGTVTLQFDNEKELTMTGIDNYGLKPSETKIKGTGDIKITTDANVDKFSLMLECHKETGFSNG